MSRRRMECGPEYEGQLDKSDRVQYEPGQENNILAPPMGGLDNAVIGPDSVDYNAWFGQGVQLGLDSATSGNLIPNADIEAKFSAGRAITMSGLGL